MISSSRPGLLAVLALVACSIGVEQGEADVGQEQECLQLFETCVELAGESPGCTEVFQFCQGSIEPTGTGGATPGGCEQNYIECLAGGSSLEDCQPLLDVCMPAGSTTGCSPLEPGCPGGDEFGATTDEPECQPDESCDSDENDCEQRQQLCEEFLGEEAAPACIELHDACQTGDCDYALSLCARLLRQPEICGELTGCETTSTPDSCDELLNACARMDLSPTQCADVFPDSPECFPEQPTGCPWYAQECETMFNPSFCQDGQLACQGGWLPEVFACGVFFPDACSLAQLTDSACIQAESSCSNGFYEVENCPSTPLYNDPYQWLAELAECNQWI